MRDNMVVAFDEWRADAMRDISKMPNRFDAFQAGWQAAEEYYECERKELTEMELRARRGCTDSSSV